MQDAWRIFILVLLSFSVALAASAQDESNAPVPASAAAITASAGSAAQASPEVGESGAELAKKLNNPWRGVATDSVSDKPQKDDQRINKALEKMFAKYPGA